MKKLLAILLAVAMLFCFAGCGNKGNDDELLGMSASPIDAVKLDVDYEVPDDFKIGFICLHDENSTYDLNFLNAVDKIQEAAGLKRLPAAPCSAPPRSCPGCMPLPFPRTEGSSRWRSRVPPGTF